MNVKDKINLFEETSKESCGQLSTFEEKFLVKQNGGQVQIEENEKNSPKSGENIKTKNFQSNISLAALNSSNLNAKNLDNFQLKLNNVGAKILHSVSNNYSLVTNANISHALTNSFPFFYPKIPGDWCKGATETSEKDFETQTPQKKLQKKAACLKSNNDFDLCPLMDLGAVLFASTLPVLPSPSASFHSFTSSFPRPTVHPSLFPLTQPYFNSLEFYPEKFSFYFPEILPNGGKNQVSSYGSKIPLFNYPLMANCNQKAFVKFKTHPEAFNNFSSQYHNSAKSDLSEYSVLFLPEKSLLMCP